MTSTTLRSTLLVLAATTLAATGCQNPCAGFNAYKGYERTDPTDPEYKVKVDEKPGMFRVVVFRIGDEKAIETAMGEALKACGGGTPNKLSDGEVVSTMLDFARGVGGPYAERQAQLGRYECSFKAPTLDTLKTPIEVQWKGDVKPKTLKVNEDGAQVTLLELGQGEYRLVFAPEANLYAQAVNLQRKGTGFGFKTRPFDLLQAGQGVQLEPIGETLEIVPPPVSIYEIQSFGGDLSGFLCELLRERRHLEDGSVASFSMKQTYVWLDAEGGKGAAGIQINASWKHEQATGLPEGLVAKLAPFGDFAVGDGEDDRGKFSLKADFDDATRQVTIRFSLETKGDKDPAEDVVTFNYTISGQPYTERVRWRGGAAPGQK